MSQGVPATIEEKREELARLDARRRAMQDQLRQSQSKPNGSTYRAGLPSLSNTGGAPAASTSWLSTITSWLPSIPAPVSRVASSIASVFTSWDPEVLGDQDKYINDKGLSWAQVGYRVGKYTTISLALGSGAAGLAPMPEWFERAKGNNPVHPAGTLVESGASDQTVYGSGWAPISVAPNTTTTASNPSALTGICAVGSFANNSEGAFQTFVLPNGENFTLNAEHASQVVCNNYLNVSLADAGTHEIILVDAAGNATSVFGITANQTGLTSNTIDVSVTHIEPPTPPTPPVPAPAYTGEPSNPVVENGGSATMYQEMGVVNLNSSLPANMTFNGLFTALDGSGLVCSLTVDGVTQLYNLSSPTGPGVININVPSQLVNGTLQAVTGGDCVGNATLAVTAEVAQSGQSTGPVTSTLTNEASPVPPPPPGFGFEGIPVSGQMSQGESMMPFAPVSAVHGNDTLGYNGNLTVTVAPRDASAQYCNVTLNGETYVIALNSPMAQVPVNASSQAALNTEVEAAEIGPCQGNITITSGFTVANGNTTANTGTSVLQNMAPPIPPEPPVTLLGSGNSTTFANSEVIQPYANVTAVNGDDTQPYTVVSNNTFTPNDASGDSCTVTAGGQSQVYNSTNPTGALLIPASTQNQVNVIIPSLSLSCQGNATMAGSISVQNGNDTSNSVTAVDQHIQSPVPACTVVALTNTPDSASCPRALPCQIAPHVGSMVVSGNPSDEFVHTINYQPSLLGACPSTFPNQVSSGVCASNPTPASQAGSLYNTATTTYLGFGTVASVTASAQQIDGNCPPIQFGVVTNVARRVDLAL